MLLFQIFYHDLASFVGASNSISISVGSTTVNMEITHKEGRDHLLFINLHRDEETSVKAGKEELGRGGTLVELLVPGKKVEREVEFELGGKKYSFDPNRIFSDEGIWGTLKALGKNGIWHDLLHYRKANQKAFDAVQNFREKLLEGLDLATQSYGLERIVALHNNQKGRRGGTNIESYLKGGARENDAEDVYAGDRKNPDDFFLVTKRKDFEGIKGKGYNVVLQSEGAEDDGSLSVYIAKMRPVLSYINCEAGFSHLEGQKKMLKDALK